MMESLVLISVKVGLSTGINWREKNHMNCKQSFSKAVSLVPNYSKRSKTGVGKGFGNLPSGHFSYLNTSVVLPHLVISLQQICPKFSIDVSSHSQALPMCDLYCKQWKPGRGLGMRLGYIIFVSQSNVQRTHSTMAVN